MRHINRSSASRCASASDPSLGACRGFSLVELLMVIGIIALLVSIIVPTISKARENAIRVQCASNLRQVGMAERMYANENRGYIFLRANAHAGTIDYLSAPHSGLMSTTLTKYAPANIWYCPSYRSTQRLQRQPWEDKDKAAAVANHRIGYGVFGAAWNGTDVVQSNPWWGVHLFINAAGFKIHHMSARYVRMTEWFSSTGNYSVDEAWVFHHRRRFAKTDATKPRPEGGNMLMGDGSVQWSQGMFRYFGGEIYTVPESRNNWQ